MNRFARGVTILLAAIVSFGMSSNVIAQSSSDEIEITINEYVEPEPGVVSVSVTARDFAPVTYSGAAQTASGILDFESTDARADTSGAWSATASVTDFGTSDSSASFVADIDLNRYVLTGLLSGVTAPMVTHIDSGSPPVSAIVLSSTGAAGVPQSVTAGYGAAVYIPPAQTPGSYSATVTVTVAGGGNP